ncbi:kinase-like domain-containing protein [Boletus reticuloceps]|uniref:Kinase-like domain-containing protein n=1 Tax=Boletus reticuloceps TaxID=495285 RepID=A0A8I3AFV2_9AGAM|nr:kinase-like domain-containing protein [Boletus reticuloceps]
MSLVSLWMPNDTLQNFLAKHNDSLGVAHRLRVKFQHLSCLNVRQNNVLLDADYTARLTDFGYASLVGNIPEALIYLRRSTTRPGALRWTAPEQIVPEDTFSRTTKSDIYTFGCVGLQESSLSATARLILIFLQVLSGKQPWSEVREDAAVVLRLARGYKPARPESGPVDNMHWELIEKCWSSIQERPDAEAITASIRRFLSYYPQFQPLRDIMGTSESSETRFGLSTAESYADNPYKRRV